MTMSDSSTSRWSRSRSTQPCRAVWHWLTFGLASIGFVVSTQMSIESFSNDQAKESPARSNEAMPAHTKVASDRVHIGPEYIPRRTDLPSQLIVSAGQTFELPADATYDYIEVAGILRVSRAQDSTLRFTTMVILPGGTFDAGTQADPIPCGRTVDLIV